MINVSGIRNFAKQNWGYPENLRMLELGPNLFQFIFGKEGDRERVLKGGPWPIDNQVFAVHKWEEGLENDNSRLGMVDFCVQVWNLPLHWHSKEVGFKIDKVFPEFKEVLIPQFGG